jgi:parallel beta-helix repeat protein
VTGFPAPPIVFQGYTANGAVNAGGFVATYIAGTTTPIATYTDATLGTPNTNPTPLNAIGQAAIWLTPGLTYKFVETDKAGNQCGFADQVPGGISLANLTAILTQSFLGSVIYPPLAAEGSTVVNDWYPYGNINRYGTNSTPGSTDMSTALTSALAAGFSVYLPATNYQFSQAAPFSIKAGQTVYGDGPSSVANFSYNVANNLQMSNVIGAVVRDLALTGNAGGANPYNGVVAIVAGSSYCKVERVTVSGCASSGVYLNSANNNTIRNNSFTGFTGINQDQSDILLGISGTGCSYNVIDGNECFGGGFHGIALEATSGSPNLYNIVTNNRVGQHAAYGILSYSSTSIVDNFNQIIGNYVENIQGNVLSGASGAGIYAVGAGGEVIANNIIRNCCVQTSATTLAPGAIGISNSSATTPCSVTGNVISGMTKYYGIYVTTSTVGATITGNSIAHPVNTTGSPIGINASSNMAVSANQITNASGQASIQFNSSTNQSNWTISGNNVTGAAIPLQITFTSTPTFSNVTISGNQLTCSAAFNGILAQQIVGGSITGNSISTGAAVALQVNACVQLRVSANNLLCTATQYALATSGTCTGSLADESNFYSATGGPTLGANAIDNAGTGFNCRSMLSGSPGAGVAVAGDVSYNLAGATPFAYYFTTSWIGLTLP